MEVTFLLLGALGLIQELESCIRLSGGPNLAQRGIATQSSTYDQYKKENARRGKDGNREQNAKKTPCTHTAFQTNPWWTVKLMEKNKIGVVVLYNRNDCCQTRLIGARVSVDDYYGMDSPVCGVVGEKDVFRKQIIVCCGGRLGQIIKVDIPDRKEYLSLCEVEVYALKTRSRELHVSHSQ